MKTITANAFIKRLNRNLAKDGLRLRTSHDGFYTVDERNVVEHQGLTWDTLLNWGKEARLLKADEQVAA